MRTCEIAVVGLGLMGAATLRALTLRKADAIGFDPLPVGALKGSSHGTSRIFRRFNFENPAYTALSDQAIAGWRSLEDASGKTILRPCQVLEAGPPGSLVVQASRAAAASVEGATGPTSGEEANAMFDALRLPNQWNVVVQDHGAILLAEAAMQAFRAGYAANIVPETVRLERRYDGIHLYTRQDEFLAQTVIVAAGPWLADILPELKPLVTITRQTVGWFSPCEPSTVSFGRFPIFLIDGPHGIIYGFPDFEGRGVKAGRHNHGPRVGAAEWDPAPTDDELQPVSETLKTFIPGAFGPLTERDVCLYTNTRAADVRVDLGEEFILDRLAQDPRILVASPCSGHGAKFATAIGDILADMALDRGVLADPAFRLDRFSEFATPQAGSNRPH